MKNLLIAILASTSLLSVPSAKPTSTTAQAAADSALLASEGRRVYRKACVGCHGVRGDGNGIAARDLDPRPQNFTTGNYKFRSTASDSLPEREDLLRTISEGVPGTTMPAWKELLTLRERRAVAEYLRGFTARFATEEPERIVPPPEKLKVLPASAQSLARGKEIYQQMKCAQCHGAVGRGDGPAVATLKDDAGRHIEPLDFTRGFYKGGSSPKDVYRTLVTGLLGTPMPAYGESLPKEEDRWALVHYVRSLSRGRPFWYYLLGPQTTWE